MEEREQAGSVWTPPVIADHGEDGRPVFSVGGRRFVEVPLGADDAYRFLGELRLEMSGAQFRAFVEKHRADLSGAVLWRLGLGPVPVAPEAPVRQGSGRPEWNRRAPDRFERARAELRQLLRAA